jgi:hypothetical protein
MFRLRAIARLLAEVKKINTARDELLVDRKRYMRRIFENERLVRSRIAAALEPEQSTKEDAWRVA